MPGPATPGAAAELQPTTPPLAILQLLHPPPLQSHRHGPCPRLFSGPERAPRCIAQVDGGLDDAE